MNSASEYERIIWLHNQFKNKSFSKDNYFHQFCLSDRTFQRDIEKLRVNFNAPLENKNGKYFYTDATFEFPALLLNEQELYGLMISSTVMEMYKDSPMYTSLKLIFERLLNLLSEDVKYLYSDLKINKGNQKVRDFNFLYLQQIIKAISQRKLLKIKYHSFARNEITERILEPYHIFNFKGEFYLVAFCNKNKSFRDFFIGRIKSLELLDGKFQPRKFDPEKYFSNKQWGILKGGKTEKVVFKVSKDKEPWIVERYNDRLKKIKEEDKWTTYEVEVEVTDEFVNWVIQYGDQIVIEKPISVKNLIMKECEKILKNYKQ